ncbi:MAG: L,D-transpeptidase family protein [Wenzhouxiangellaceae bacterium]|nr:L,D-transpeptidase family protein [Wenzhouxiangellaceae bacterium]
MTWPDDGSDVIGELIRDRLRGDETLLDVARLHNIGFLEIVAANPTLDPWLPKPGAEVIIPQLHVLPEGEREGIVINRGERRMYYFAERWPDRDGPVIVTDPVGIGIAGRDTPTTETRVTARLDQPAWYPTAEVRAWYKRERNIELPVMVPAGDDNPLGEHALVLDGDGLLIHGTIRPAGVGMAVSQGCIRLYPERIRFLVQQVPIGTSVRIIDQPVRLGRRGDKLYLEVDPVDDEGSAHPETRWTELQARLGRRAGTIDHALARELFERADGIPRVIGTLD